MRWLSRSLDELGLRYEVVVVGSGYGGGVAACRFAEAGREVVVLERGRELRPGDFPRSLGEALGELQLTSPQGRRVGAEGGLYDLRLGEHQHVLIGSGLGGTSLINAGVALEPPPELWTQPPWPQALRQDETGRSRAYTRAREMLHPTTLPQDSDGRARLRAQRRLARQLGGKVMRLPLTLRFAPGLSSGGEPQAACVHCGSCASGCNYGAKTTVAHTYLSRAARAGAQIFCEVEVLRVERHGTGWRLWLRPVDMGQERFGNRPLFIDAEQVVLAAGSMGSTEILLRSAAAGLPLSPCLGARVSANGNALTLGLSPSDVGLVPLSDGRVDPDAAPGPCITSAVDLRGAPDWGEGMLLEDGAPPSPLVPLLGAVLASTSSDQTGWFEQLWMGIFAGERTERLLPMLAVGHDSSPGRMQLGEERAVLRWPDGPDQRLAELHQRLSKALPRGDYLGAPLWSHMLGRSTITVHPLGGCAMAEDAERGVVDDRGRVYAGDRGNAVHLGLYVWDGSILPCSIGVNPLLTITALAERAVALVLETQTLRSPRSALPSPPPRVGLRFSESMSGLLQSPTGQDLPLSFTVTALFEDLEALLADPSTPGRLMGTVDCAPLSAAPLRLERGRLRLFSPDGPGRWRMRYELHLASVEGQRWTLQGHKLLRDDPGVDAWRDTTTLLVDLHQHGAEVARGTLGLSAADFLQQLRTMTVLHAPDPAAEARALARFGRMFLGALWEIYGLV